MTALREKWGNTIGPSGPAARRGTVVAALAIAFALLLGAAWSGQRWAPASEPLPSAIDKVVVFGMGPIGFDDVGHGDTPTLDRLLDTGSVGAMSVRTGVRHPSLPEGYLSLGAGFRLVGDRQAGEAYPGTDELPGGTAAEVLQQRTGSKIDGDIAVIGAVPSVDRNSKSTISSGPGALGQALADAGKVSAVIGNADEIDPVTGDIRVNRPATLAVMDEDLSVDHGVIDRDTLIEDDASSPYGIRANPAAMAKAFTGALRTSDVVVVDPGELSRAESFRAVATPVAQKLARTTALRRTDAILRQVVATAGPRTLVLVVSLAATGGGFHLTPFVATGAGVAHGYAVSPSTKRAGLVALTDVAPTVLDALGVTVPDEMPGNPVRMEPGRGDLGMLKRWDRDTDFRERTYYPWALTFIIFLAVVYGFAAATSSGPRLRPRFVTGLRFLALVGAAFPLASFLFRLAPGFSSLGDGAFPVVVAITVVLALGALRFQATPLRPLQIVLAGTVAIILLDASTGTWLHVNSWLGYSLHNAGRFYGIPNTTYALIGAGALLLGASVMAEARRRREAFLVVALLFGLTAIVDGAPTLGGDVGGIVSLVPVFGVALLALTGRRFRVRSLLGVGLTTVAALGVAVGLDLMRPPEARTHLGRFASTVFKDGPGEIVDTFMRKESANMRILSTSIWTWVVPIAVVYLGTVLWRRGGWGSIMPRRSPLRVGFVAAVAGAVVGFLTNDSGPITVALFLVYVLPYVLFLSLADQEASADALDLSAEAAGSVHPDGAADAITGR